MAKTIKLIEEAVIQGVASADKKLKEAFGSEAPDVIYPEIRAITADKVTRNKTYYPLSAIYGDSKNHTGLVSWLYPYPKPVIEGHQTGNIFSAPSKVFGRVKYATLASDGTSQYVSIIPAITDKEAIQKILNGEFLTVSIGVDCTSVKCSICGSDCVREDEGICDHQRGQMYDVDGAQKECYWIIEGLTFDELSFVIVPSDNEAMVLKKNVERLPIIGVESKTFGEFLVDSWKGKCKKMKEETDKMVQDAEEEDPICTLGDLYGLDKDDPDYGTPDEGAATEAPLTTKQRKALPDSAFCGPNRSFPAHDRAHCIAGLRLLGRYKGPGSKAKIRACLLRRLAKYKKDDGEMAPLGYLYDEKYQVEYPLFPTDNADFTAVYSSVKASNFTDEQKNQMLSALVGYYEKAGKPIPEELSGITAGEAVRIELNQDTYPLLYSVIDALEDYMLETSITEQENATEESVVTESTTDAVEVEEAKAVPAQPAQPAPQPAPAQPASQPAPAQPAPQPAPAQPVPQPAPTKPAPAQKPVSEPAVADAQEPQETANNDLIKENNELKEKLASAEEALHDQVIATIAILQKSLGMSASEQRTIAELQEELKETTVAEGLTIYKFLAAELDKRTNKIEVTTVTVTKEQPQQAPPIDVSLATLEKLTDPVIRTDQDATKAPGYVSPITEEDAGDRILLYTGGNNSIQGFKESVEKSLAIYGIMPRKDATTNKETQ